MPSPKHPCPQCQTPTRASLCKNCTPPYERTPERNQAMSTRTTGILRPGFVPPSKSDYVSEKIRSWWTPERREARRLKMQEFALDPVWRLKCGQPGAMNPMWEDGRTVIPYARGWSRKVKAIAWERANHHCEICQSDKPCDTHHKDFRKDNHDLENLQVLCRKCHKRLHAEHLRPPQ